MTFIIRDSLKKLFDSNILNRYKVCNLKYFSYTTNGTDKKKKIVQNPTKEELQWRLPVGKRSGEFYSKLKVFAPESDEPDNRAEIVKLLQTPIDIRPSAIKNWVYRRHQEMIELDQLFNPQRLEILGSELAAAHFIVARGGKVKFFNNPNWICKNAKGRYELYNHYDPNYIIEAIDCEGLPLTFDGLENMKGLEKIKSFSVKNCSAIDDWCVDRITGQYYETLEELDLTDCPNVTPRGLEAIYKLKNLKLLKLTQEDSKIYEMVCLLLEELIPNLIIEHYEPKKSQL